jgi:hypothetical protein
MRQDGGVTPAADVSTAASADVSAAEEQARLERMRLRNRRQPVILIVIFNVLITLVGWTAVIDLRRLQTPGGTGLRWLQAAVFGDCDDYLTFSLPDPERPDRRSKQEFCQDLRAASTAAKDEQLKIGFELEQVRADRVRLQLIRKGVARTVELHVVKHEGHWRVLRDDVTCRSAGCA